MKVPSFLNTSDNQSILEQYPKVPVLSLLNPSVPYEPSILECTTGVNTFNTIKAINDQTITIGSPCNDTLHYTAEPHELYRVVIRDRRHEMATRRGGRRGRPARCSRNGYLTPSPSVSPRPKQRSHGSGNYRCGSSPSPQPKPRRSNKPYTPEQLAWIRYHHHDRGFKWPFCKQLYSVAFHGDTIRNSPQCMNSRFYRDNKWPVFTDDGEPVLDQDGNQLMEQVKIRDRRRENHLCDKKYPLSLIYKSPESVEHFRYRWILPEDMRRLEKHLKDIKNDPIETKKYLYRRSLLLKSEKPMMTFFRAKL